MNRLSLIFKWNSELLEASTLKPPKETGWSQVNIWSLTALDFFDLGRLKIKESLFISRDQPVLNKNEASLPLHMFDQLHKYFTIL